MNRRQLLMGGLVAAAATALPAQAGDRRERAPQYTDPRHNDSHDHGSPDHCPSRHRRIVGSWFGSVEAFVNGASIGAFNDLLSVFENGVMTESRRYVIANSPMGPLVETTGHGAWKALEDGSFELFFRVIMERQNGAQFGTDNVRLVVSHDPVADTLSGTFEAEIKDRNDNVRMTVTGNYSASRISV